MAADTGLVIKQVESLFHHAETARQAHQNQWDTNWSLYRNRYDWRRKASWQSQAAYPKVPMLVDFASDEVARALYTSGRYFAFDAHGQDAKQRAVMGEAITRDWLQRPEVHFPAKIAEGVRGAMLCGGMVLKLRWDTQLRVDVIDPYDFWEDPLNRRRFVIHRSVRDYDQLLGMAEDGFFDEEMVRSLTGGTGRVETDKWRERAGLTEPAHASGRRSVEVLELWGTIHDDLGEVLEGCENCWCVLADRNTLIRPPEPNPYWHGEWPFIRVQPNPTPFSPYGKGLIDDVAPMAEQLTNLVNLLYDATVLDTIPMWEVDRGAMMYDSQLARGLYPGVMLERNGPNPILMAAQKQYTGSNLVLPVVNLFSTQIENQAGVTQDAMGHTGRGPRRTATEATGQLQQSARFLANLGRSIEMDGIAPLAERAFKTIVQYMPSALYISPRFTEILGSSRAFILASMSNEQRYQYLCTQYTVRGRGVSGIFTRQEDLGRLMQFMQMLQLQPQWGALVNDDVVMRKVLEALGWESDDVMITDPAEIAQKRQELMMQQMMMQQQGGGQQALRGSQQGGGPAWQNPVEQEQTGPRMVEGV